MNDTFILDATCGGRMMWFDKHHPNALYVDRRTLPMGAIDQQPGFSVEPDEIEDFTDLPYEGGSFKLVVFDPPHIVQPGGESSILGMKYGVLAEGWQDEITAGFRECWRVLDWYGVLVFKWGEASVTVREVLDLLPEGMNPLFGHTTGKSGKTKWIVFMKVPADE